MFTDSTQIVFLIPFIVGLFLLLARLDLSLARRSRRSQYHTQQHVG
jgi:hypothetical protein